MFIALLLVYSDAHANVRQKWTSWVVVAELEWTRNVCRFWNVSLKNILWIVVPPPVRRVSTKHRRILFFMYYYFFFLITFEIKTSTMLIFKSLHHMRAGQVLQLQHPRSHGDCRVKYPRLPVLNLWAWDLNRIFEIMAQFIIFFSESGEISQATAL